MILVDTSVWVSHFRRRNSRLEDLLSKEFVCCHPLVIGELACGHLANRSEILHLLSDLPMAKTASDQEALVFIDKHKLMGKGLGIVDIHLLVSALLSGQSLWTEDKLMHQTARYLDIQML